MRTRWIIAAVVAVVGLVFIGQGTSILAGSGGMYGDSRWAIVGAGDGRRSARRSAGPPFRNRRRGLSQPVQVVSSGPTVTEFPNRTSGSLSRLASASRRATISRVVEPHVGEPLVAVGPAVDVQQRPGAELLDEPLQLPGGDRPLAEVRRMDGDPSLPEEPQCGARGGRVRPPEDLDVRHLLGRGLRERSWHRIPDSLRPPAAWSGRAVATGYHGRHRRCRLDGLVHGQARRSPGFAGTRRRSARRSRRQHHRDRRRGRGHRWRADADDFGPGRHPRGVRRPRHWPYEEHDPTGGVEPDTMSVSDLRPGAAGRGSLG